MSRVAAEATVERSPTLSTPHRTIVSMLSVALSAVLAVALASTPASAQPSTNPVPDAGQASHRSPPTKATGDVALAAPADARGSSECSSLANRRDAMRKANQKSFVCLDSQNSTDRTRPEHRTNRSMREALDASILSVDTMFEWCRDHPDEWYLYRDEACIYNTDIDWDIRDVQTDALLGEIELVTFHYILTTNGVANFSERIVVTPASYWGAGATAVYDINLNCVGNCGNISDDGIGPTPVTLAADGTWYFTSTIGSEAIGWGHTAMVMSMANTNPNILPGFDTIESEATVRCDTLVSYLELPGCVFPEYEPTASWSTAGPYSEVAQHIKDAQATGLPGKPGTQPLHRLRDAVLRGLNRDTACPDSFPKPAGKSCDEYPFASTWEGAYTGSGGYSARGRCAAEHRPRQRSQQILRGESCS
jgi:hypothetical protein